MFNRHILLQKMFSMSLRYTHRNVQREIVQKSFDLKYPDAYRLIKNYPLIRNLEPIKLRATIDRLMKLGFTSNDMLEFPSILSINDKTLVHQYNLLKEIGFTKITIELILNYLTIFKKEVKLLKDYNYIPMELNVAQHLLKYCGPNSEKITVHDLNDGQLLREVVTTVLKRVLANEFNITLEKLESIVKIYPKTMNRSFKLLLENVHLLRDIGFSNERILRHWYILSLNPENIRDLLKTFPTLAGEDSKTLFFKHPKLLEINAVQIQDIYNILQSYHITEDMMKKYINIFTLNPNTVKERLHEINTIPQLKVLAHHPRVLLLVLFQNKAKSRMLYLKRLQRNNLTVNLLCSHEAAFEKFTSVGYKTIGNDAINFITTELQMESDGLRKIFNNHPYWSEVPMTRIAKTITYMKEVRKFSNKDLAKVPYVLFYPREIIDEAFDEIQKEDLLLNKYITEEQKLNLLMYYMEKPFHFTGNGVWSLKERKNRPDNVNSPT